MVASAFLVTVTAAVVIVSFFWYGFLLSVFMECEKMASVIDILLVSVMEGFINEKKPACARFRGQLFQGEPFVTL